MARATSNRPESTRRRQRWPDGYDPENTRKSLIASALELFEKRGFDRTSVQEIADRAKLTKGAFYHHFESKDDLLRHIQEEYLEAQLAAIAKIEAGSDDPKVRVAELIRFSLTSVAEYRAHVTIFYQERRNLTADLFAEVTRKRSLVESAFAGMIADGVAGGRSAPTSTRASPRSGWSGCAPGRTSGSTSAARSASRRWRASSARWCWRASTPDRRPAGRRPGRRPGRLSTGPAPTGRRPGQPPRSWRAITMRCTWLVPS